MTNVAKKKFVMVEKAIKDDVWNERMKRLVVVNNNSEGEVE